MWLEDKLYKYLQTTNEIAFEDNCELGDERKSRGYIWQISTYTKCTLYLSNKFTKKWNNINIHHKPIELLIYAVRKYPLCSVRTSCSIICHLLKMCISMSLSFPVPQSRPLQNLSASAYQNPNILTCRPYEATLTVKIKIGIFTNDKYAYTLKSFPFLFINCTPCCATSAVIQ
jgi:hypothetical protein